MAEIVFETNETRTSRTSGILWGLAKCGKTTFLTGLPGKKLFVLFDPDGDQSLPDHEDITILRLYEQSDDLILRYATNTLPTILRKGEYDSVIYDSLSTLGQIALMQAIKDKIGESKIFTPSIEAPGLSAYGARTANIVNIVSRALRATGAVGAHCWFTSHEDEPKTDDKGNFLHITLTLSGKASSQVGLNVSEIWHMSVNDGKWRIMVAPGRGKKPMGSRMFDVTGSTEFVLRFDPAKGEHQEHSIAQWFNKWIEGGRQKLPVPK